MLRHRRESGNPECQAANSGQKISIQSAVDSRESGNDGKKLKELQGRTAMNVNFQSKCDSPDYLVP